MPFNTTKHSETFSINLQKHNGIMQHILSAHIVLMLYFCTSRTCFALLKFNEVMVWIINEAGMYISSSKNLFFKCRLRHEKVYELIDLDMHLNIPFILLVWRIFELSESTFIIGFSDSLYMFNIKHIGVLYPITEIDKHWVQIIIL